MEPWAKTFSDLLKIIEKSKQQNSSVKEFRRSFEAGRKKDRVKTQLNKIYTKVHSTIPKTNNNIDKVNLDWVDKFNAMKFSVKLGQKSVGLSCPANTEGFARTLLLLFCELHPELVKSVDESLLRELFSGLGEEKKKPLISSKKKEKALKKIKGLNEQQLRKLKNNVPESQIKALASNPEMVAMAKDLQEDQELNRVANSIRDS